MPLWKPYFRIDCNQTDRLIFKIIAKEKEIGLSELYCTKFVKENRKVLSW